MRPEACSDGLAVGGGGGGLRTGVERAPPTSWHLDIECCSAQLSHARSHPFPTSSHYLTHSPRFPPPVPSQPKANCPHSPPHAGIVLRNYAPSNARVRYLAGSQHLDLRRPRGSLAVPELVKEPPTSRHLRYSVHRPDQRRSTATLIVLLRHALARLLSSHPASGTCPPEFVLSMLLRGVPRRPRCGDVYSCKKVTETFTARHL
jgi:hypothetical protein